MKKLANAVIVFLTTFMCSPLLLFAEEINIPDSPVPEAAASHCTIHWGVLGIVAIYGIYALSRALMNKKTLSEEVVNSEDR